MISISSKNKPTLSFWQIWNMSFGFFGIQFGFALQNGNASRIFSTLGAPENELAVLWLAAPITGLIVQPLIGYYSDRTWHPKWGRRRPYFTIGALLASLSLCLMPNSPALWMAAGMLWIMDASINVSMEPFRALVGDVLNPAQRTKGFAFQSLFIGAGAIIASFMPWIFKNWLHVSNRAPEGEIADSVKYSFYIGALVLFITVMWTVFTTKEYPPSTETEISLKNREKRKIDNEAFYRKRFFDIGLVLTIVAIAFSILLYFTNPGKELYILSFIFGLFGIIHLISAVYISQGRSYLGIVNIVKDFNTMPKTMIQLAFVQFFSWFALFAMWIYTTPAVTSYIFNSTDTTSAAYNNGADLVGNLFGIYNGIAALVALMLPILARYTSRRITHMIALICGGIGLISFYFVSEPNYLYLSMIGVGIAWASILSVPYAMLSGSLPAEKMGYYMGVFNFFIVIPQIVAGTLLGFMLTHLFNGQSIYILVAGGISMFIAGLLCLRVKDDEEVVIKQAL